jgi:hypothetical protein
MSPDATLVARLCADEVLPQLRAAFDREPDLRTPAA